MGVKMADYANPNALVDTEWVAQNLDAPGVRLVEVDVDTAAYDQGHAPGARRLELEIPAPGIRRAGRC